MYFTTCLKLIESAINFKKTMFSFFAKDVNISKFSRFFYSDFRFNNSFEYKLIYMP